MTPSIRPRHALLDTSVLIDYPADAVAAVADEVSVGAISIAELQYGVGAGRDALEQMRRRRRLSAILGQFDVLPFDVESAEHYGALAELVRATGRDPRPRRLDLQIAATAARHGLALVTRNSGDFAGLERALPIVTV